MLRCLGRLRHQGRALELGPHVVIASIAAVGCHPHSRMSTRAHSAIAAIAAVGCHPNSRRSTRAHSAGFAAHGTPAAAPNSPSRYGKKAKEGEGGRKKEL